jgi:Protein of unknown function (DUF2914)
MLQKLKEKFLKFEPFISPIALLGGFVFDNLTLKRIDDLWSMVPLLLYLIAILLCVIFVNLAEGKGWAGKFSLFAKTLSIVLMQFCFGAVFSVFAVFYIRSASFLTSWPFLLFLIALLIGNEYVRKHYVNFAFHMSIYYVALFSFSIFSLPIVLHRMGEWVFLLAGVVSFTLLKVIMQILTRFVPERVREGERSLYISVGIIFVTLNLLYFFNIIPPIPLSLKDIGIYHSVVRDPNGDYIVTTEDQRWYSSLRVLDTIHVLPHESVYLYSSVFAPTGLATKIVHHWFQYNSIQKKWISSSQIPFSIVGGKDAGYRGYSIKEDITGGKWRVDIETMRGQVIGRLTFNVEQIDDISQVKLLTKIKELKK